MTSALECCVYCDALSAQRVACESPAVEAWWCAVFGERWWCSVVSPHPFLDRLAGRVALRSVLREAIKLAEAAPGLSDEQLRTRALMLLIRLAQHAGMTPGQGHTQSNSWTGQDSRRGSGTRGHYPFLPYSGPTPGTVIS